MRIRKITCPYCSELIFPVKIKCSECGKYLPTDLLPKVDIPIKTINRENCGRCRLKKACLKDLEGGATISKYLRTGTCVTNLTEEQKVGQNGL